MTKDLSKNIMKRSRLRNKYLKNKNEENRNCVPNNEIIASLLRKTKKAYHDERRTMIKLR